MKTASLAITLLFAICLAALLAACGGGGEGTGTPSPQPWSTLTAVASPAATRTPDATPTAVTDGQFPIAYSDDEQGDMWVVPADGIGKQNVTMGRCPHPSQFYFSPQGDRVACISSTNDGKTEMCIFLFDPGGGYRQPSCVKRDGLFAGFSWPGMADESPSSLWSSSQQYMAYVLEQGPPPGTPHLYISEAAGIRKEIPGGQQPRWSAEGDRIAYNQPPDDTLVLYEPHTGDEKALGTGLRPLAWVLNDTSLLVAANAKVDPQFYTDRLTYEANLLDLTSGEMTRVPQLDDSAKFWLSPDRTKAVVQRQGQPLGVLDLATLRFTSIAPAEGRSYSVPCDYDVRRQLSFTPDGSRIYWFGSNKAIYSASSDGTVLPELRPTYARGRFLGFSPDATQVLLLIADKEGLWAANVDGSDRHLVADKTPSDAAWGPWASLTEPVTIDGARVVPLNSAKGAEFPDDVALIVEATCRACDGPSSGLYLVYRDASGQVRMDELFADETMGLLPPAMSTPTAIGPYGPYIHSLALSSDASDIVVDVCTRGRCDRTGIGEASPDAQSTLYRSTDGGVTWEELGVLDGSYYVEALAKEGLLLSGPWGPETEWKPKYQLFPSGEPLEPPPGASRGPLTLPDGELAWPTDDGRLLRGDGSQFLTVSQGRTVPDTVRNIVPDASGERLAVASRRGLGLFSRDGQPIRLFESWEFPGVGAWLSDTLFAGHKTLPPILPPDSDEWYTVPVIFDLEAGEKHSILDTLFVQSGRFSYVVRAALLGPFARVVNTGSCLNVRAQPAMAAEALTCAADGVLLRDTGETREVEGVTWCRVVTPAGVEGWASAQYLER